MATLLLDHALSPNHDAVDHGAVFHGSEGNIFCVQCASECFDSAPNFRRLALMESVTNILKLRGPSAMIGDSIDACLTMLLQGMDSADASVVQSTVEAMLGLKRELPDPVGVLAVLASRTMSLGLPRASGHLYLIGQLLTQLSHDHTLVITLGRACVRQNDSRTAGTSGRAARFGGEHFVTFASFLASHAASASCLDHVKSDVIYVSMELLDFCTMAGVASQAPAHLPRPENIAPPPAPAADPFVCVMMAIPRLLARRSSCDEPLQLHSIAYLATAIAYCHQRTEYAVPGWSCNAAGVPDVLLTAFGIFSSEMDHDLARHEEVPTGGFTHSSPSDLCGTLKAMLMSSSFGVRSATARLLASLCNYGAPSVGDSTPSRDAEHSTKAGTFFRETLIAAGTTDFLFEAIKNEREGTPRHYLEAMEAFALSPVEFFHAGNFSMKFAAPILLRASRGQAVCSISRGHGSSDDDEHSTSAHYNEVASVRRLSHRLVLQALVAVPPSSSAGFVEQLLATAAASTNQGAIGRSNAIELAADVLSLIACGEIELCKGGSRTSLIGAIKTLLDHLEEDLVCAARLRCQEASLTPCVSEGDSPDFTAHTSLYFQMARVMEYSLNIAQQWVLSQKKTSSLTIEHTRPLVGTRDSRASREGSFVMADLVFGVFGRTLMYQLELAARSDNLAHSIAFVYCIGAAIDATSTVLHECCQEGRKGDGDRDSFRLSLIAPSFFSTEDLQDSAEAGGDRGPTSHPGGRDDTGAASTASRSASHTDDPSVRASATCLKTILEVTVEADIVFWLLHLWKQCGTTTDGGIEKSIHDGDADAESNSVLTSLGSDENSSYLIATRESLVEVLRSLVYAQGWVNGMFTSEMDHSSCASRSTSDRWGGRKRSNSVADETSSSALRETLRVVLQSWSTSSPGGCDAVPLDHHVVSLLGTSADNGDLCRLVMILMSFSSTFLGILHPHPECRAEVAVTLLQYVKTLSEAIFCLNLFSHVVLARGHSWEEGEDCFTRLDRHLSSAVKDVLARFPVAELAFSPIPLSTTAVAFIARAGCREFTADWLITVPLWRIKQALAKLGASGELLYAGDTCNCSGEGVEPNEDGDGSKRIDRDDEALVAILKAIVSRWALETESGGQEQHLQVGATVRRLVCIIMVSPCIFINLSFTSTCDRNCTTDNSRQEPSAPHDLECTLPAVITQTLRQLSCVLSPMALVGFCESSGDDNWASNLKFTTQILRMASAFLHIRCARGQYALVPGALDLDKPQRESPGNSSMELALAHVCARLLRHVLDPRQGGRNRGGRYLCGDTDAMSALLSTFNSLSTLLALFGQSPEMLPGATEGLIFAFRQSYDVISGELGCTTSAVQTLTGWLVDAPDTMVSFLQVCTLWNVVGLSKLPMNGARDHRRDRLDPPCEILGEILLMGNNISHRVDECRVGSKSGVGAWSNRHSAYLPRVLRELLQILTARCVEGRASAGSFSRPQCLALQVALKGVACDGGPMVASAALRALHALWEKHPGALQPMDHVGQSWTPFVMECCLEKALRSLDRRGNDFATAATSTNPSNDPKDEALGRAHTSELGRGSILAYDVGILLHDSIKKACPQLRIPSVSRGRIAGLMHPTAITHMHGCVTLLAAELHKFLDARVRETLIEFDGTQDGGGQESSRFLRSDSADRGPNTANVELYVVDALTQTVRVLAAVEEFLKGSVGGGQARQQAIDSLSRLHPAVVDILHERGGVCVDVVGRYISLSVWSEVAPGGGCIGAGDREGVLFMDDDSWQALCDTPVPVSWVDLANEIEVLLKRESSAQRGSGVAESPSSVQSE